MRSSFESNADSEVNAGNRQAMIAELYRRYAPDAAIKVLDNATAVKLRDQLIEERKRCTHAVIELENGVRGYAKQNLNQVGMGDNYTTESVNIGNTERVAEAKTKTKMDRVRSVNTLLDIIRTSGANEIYQYVTTPAFETMSGKHETKFNLIRKHLASYIKDFTDTYELIRKLGNDANLIAILTNEYVMNTANEQELLTLFWSYNPILVADIIVNFYQRKSFQHDANPINLATLQCLLVRDPKVVAYVNRQRAQAKLPVLYTEETMTAGKNTLYEETLTPLELYQYEDPTIFAVENWLMREYSNILLNNIVGGDWPKNALNPKATPPFYMLSAAKYMLIDPRKYNDIKIDPKNPPKYLREFNTFRDDIRSLAASISEMDTAAIICGIINYDGVHYIPYFVSVTPRGVMGGLTLDPSARVFEDNARLSEDGKANAIQKIQAAFNDIFPGIHFHDPDIAQMLRERDCGPNAATTLCDAFRSSLTDQPLLIVDGEGKLSIDPRQLTVKSLPVGSNPYTGMLMYPAQLDKDSLANRAMWAARLQDITHSFPCTEVRAAKGGRHCLTCADVYHLEDQALMEFNYHDDAMRQQKQDSKETNLSALRTLLMASDEGRTLTEAITASFRNKLSMPSEKMLMQFVTRSMNPVELATLTSAHSGNLSAACKDLIIVLLKDRIPEEFSNAFTETVLNHLADSLDLKAEMIVTDFLKQHHDIFSGMSMYQQRDARRRLEQTAVVAVREKLIALHMQRFENYYRESAIFALRHIVPTEDGDVAPQVIRLYHETFGDIRPTIDYLLINQPKSLEQFIRSETEKALNSFVADMANYFNAWFSQRFKNIGEILDYYKQEQPGSSTWSVKDLADRLPLEFKTSLTDCREDSLAALRVLQVVNNNVARLAEQRLHAVCHASVSALLAKPDVIQTLITNNTLENLLSIRNDWETDLQATYKIVLDLIRRFGTPDTIMLSHLDDPKAGPYLMELLRTSVGSIFRDGQAKHFAAIREVMLKPATLLPYHIYAPRNDLHDHPQALWNALMEDMKQLGDYPAFMQSNDFIFSDPTYHRYFTEYFDNEIAGKLKQNYVRLTALIQKTMLVCSAMARLNPFMQKNFGLETSHSLTELNELLARMQQTNLFTDAEANFQTLENQLNSLFVAIVKERLFAESSYIKGDVKPQSYTCYARSVLCQLLGIETPLVCTTGNALKVDAMIATQCNQQLLANNVFSLPTLKILPERKELPPSYGTPITEELILQCISYWYTHLDWKYIASHSATWFHDQREPAVLRALISVIANNRFEEDGTLQEAAAASLKAVILKNKADSKSLLSLYTSSDLDDEVQAALLKTSSLSRSASSRISFRSLAILFNLPLPIAKPASIVPSENDILAEVDKRLQKFAEDHKLRNQGVDPSDEIIAGQRRGLMMIVRQQMSLALRAAAALPELSSVKANEVRRNTGITSLFSPNDRMNNAEKVLMKMRKKYAPQQDFYLDEEDIRILRDMLKDRWFALCHQLQSEAAARDVYLVNPRRTDKVYITLAELIARHERNQGRACISIQLISPGSGNLENLPYLRQWSLHESIIRHMGLIEPEESFIDSDYAEKAFDEVLNIADVILTRSGYALSMTCIMANYTKTRSLNNPYTEQPFSAEEMEDIAKHSRAHDLSQLVKDNMSGAITPAAIQLLKRLIIDSTFINGFNAYYSPEQNKKAEKAFAQFYHDLAKLPRKERDALMGERIPCEDKTVGLLFKESAQSCLTVRNGRIARVVVAYEGRNHGFSDELFFKIAGHLNNPYETIGTRIYKGAADQQRGLSGAEVLLCNTIDRFDPVVMVQNRKKFT
jgi:hypothetical protein